MKTGRNDPCPCGSGKKYKQCCWEKDHTQSGVIPFPGSGAPPAEWEAGFAALPVRIEDDAGALPTVLLVTAGKAVLFSEVTAHPPVEPEEVAREIERAVLEAARATGHLPARLRVHHRRVAEALGATLGPRDVEVSASEDLPDLDFLAADLRDFMGGAAGVPPAASPETWAAWGLPAARVAEIFRAAAEFFRAAPWEVLTNVDLIAADVPAGRRWTACVLGNGGLQYGLVLYEHPEDFLGMLVSEEPTVAFSGLRGSIVSLDFQPRTGVPEAMYREIRKAGWEVAGPLAYPALTVINSPGGGIGAAEAEDLTVLLRAVPRFVEEYDELFPDEPGEPPEWRDPESGAVLRPLLLMPEEEEESLWEPPFRLRTGCAEGPGADPSAAVAAPEDPDAFAEVEEGVVERFGAWLAREERFSRATVEKHTINAGLFVEYLARWQGISLRSVTEYDLRTFLYDWYPRKVADSRTRALSVPTSLRRFFAFLEQAGGISCPWADEILRDKGTFEIRLDEFPGGFWWDEEVREWQGEFYEDLAERVFLPEPGLAGGGAWGGAMGPTEALLHRELQRRWLLWRDEVIRGGATDPDEVRDALAARQRKWETSKSRALGGKTPAQAIRAERRRKR